ncbi:MAG: hypothetical protein EOO88_22135 [Pedobacter sp.]|nr:MAG: hypothetical protein EOO88_22135 [Pedobacter sp.]
MPDPNNPRGIGPRKPPSAIVTRRGIGPVKPRQGIRARTISKLDRQEITSALEFNGYKRIAKSVNADIRRSILLYKTKTNSPHIIRNSLELFKPLYTVKKAKPLSRFDRFRYKLQGKLEHLLDAIPNGTKFEINVSVGPQIGGSIGSYGAVHAKADATFVSFKLFGETYQKNKEGHEWALQAGHYKYNLIGIDGYTIEDGVDMNSKIGAEVGLGLPEIRKKSAGELAVGGSIGYAGTFNIFKDGNTNGRKVYEYAGSYNGVSGKIIEETVYGLPFKKKFETGYGIEAKCIIGIEIKLINEQDIK